MRAITRYVLRQLCTVTIVVTVALTFAIWLTQSLRFVDYIVNRGLPASSFLAFIALLLPSFLGVVLPIAGFCAVLFVYNKLVMDSELIVLRATGLSQSQLARPALILAGIVTIFVYSISLYFLPVSYRTFRELQLSHRNDYSAVLLQEGVFNTLVDGITVYVRSRTNDGELLGILVHDSRKPDKPVTMMAEQGALVVTDAGPRVVMVNGNRQEVDRKTGKLSLLYFDRYTIELAQLQENVHTRWREPRERFLPGLLDPPRQGEDLRYRDQLVAEGHHRIAAPLYSLAFIIIGLAALLSGEFNRRGQMRRILIAVLCVALLESIAVALHEIAARASGLIPVMYAGPLLPAAVGLYLLLRAPRRRRPAAEAAQATPA